MPQAREHSLTALLRHSNCPPSHYAAPKRIRVRIDKDGTMVFMGFRTTSIGGLTLCESYGRDVGGGPCYVHGGRGPGTVGDAAKLLYVVDSLLNACSFAIVTLRLYDPLQKALYALSIRRGWKPIGFIYPRLLPLYKFRSGSQYVDKGMNKKARNRWRYFRRHGGRVERIDDVTKHADSLYEALISNPYRQGRPIPRHWREPRSVARMAWRMTEQIREGIARAYAAFMDGGLVGLLFTVYTRLHGVVPFFIVHADYERYGVGNALMAEAVIDLIEAREPLVLQYGYYRPVNEGINKFLERHGFVPGVEAVIARARSGVRALFIPYKLYLEVAERMRSRRLAFAAQVLRKL